MTARKAEELSRNPGGEFQHDIDQAALDTAAARMRAAGFSYQEIADNQSVSVSTSHGRVQRALAAVPVEAVAELRTVELQRLDDMLKQALIVLRKDHPLVSHGRLVPGVSDARPKLAAIDVMLRISSSRRRLLGLDAPIKHDVKVSDSLTAEIELLAQQLGIGLDPVENVAESFTHVDNV